MGGEILGYTTLVDVHGFQLILLCIMLPVISPSKDPAVLARDNGGRFKDLHSKVRELTEDLYNLKEYLRSKEEAEKHQCYAEKRWESLYGESWSKPPKAQVTLALQQIRSDGDFRPLRDIADSLRPAAYVFRDCADVYYQGWRKSGVYRVRGDEKGSTEDAYCEHNADGGGWRVIQLRQDGSVDFNRIWDDYEKGFGHVGGEFWLGLERMHQLTRNEDQKLLVKMITVANQYAFAEYEEFSVGNSTSNYELHADNFTGHVAGDALYVNNGMQFVTKDRPNNMVAVNAGNCADVFKGGWWASGRTCGSTFLNGLYGPGSFNNHIIWRPFSSGNPALTYVKMMIKTRT